MNNFLATVLSLVARYVEKVADASTRGACRDPHHLVFMPNSWQSQLVFQSLLRASASASARRVEWLRSGGELRRGSGNAAPSYRRGGS